MKTVNNFIVTIPKWLNILFLVAIVFLLIKILYLNKTREMFSGAYDFGIITEGIIGSIIASYIFYIIVVHNKEFRDKRLTLPYINKNAGLVLSRCHLLLDSLKQATEIELKLSTAEIEDVRAIFKAIDPNSKANIVIGSADGLEDGSWREYLQIRRKETEAAIDKVMSLIIYADPVLVSLLLKIEQCTYFLMLRNIGNTPVRSLAGFGNEFHKYLLECRELNKYLEQQK